VVDLSILFGALNSKIDDDNAVSLRTGFGDDTLAIEIGHQELSNVRFLKRPNPVEHHARRHAVVLVIIEDPLLDGSIAGLDPAIKPLDRRGT
jgi:hypothetical protein